VNGSIAEPDWIKTTATEAPVNLVGLISEASLGSCSENEVRFGQGGLYMAVWQEPRPGLLAVSLGVHTVWVAPRGDERRGAFRALPPGLLSVRLFFSVSTILNVSNIERTRRENSVLLFKRIIVHCSIVEAVD